MFNSVHMLNYKINGWLHDFLLLKNSYFTLWLGRVEKKWEITVRLTGRVDPHATKSSDGVHVASSLQRSNLGPGVVGGIVLEHLETSKVKVKEFHTIPHLCFPHCSHQ